MLNVLSGISAQRYRHAVHKKLSLDWQCRWCQSDHPRFTRPVIAQHVDVTYDYTAGLQRLGQAFTLTDYDIEAAAAQEMSRLPEAGAELFGWYSGLLDCDVYSTSLLQQHVRSSWAVPPGSFAARSTGDGNCLFNAASLLISG